MVQRVSICLKGSRSVTCACNLFKNAIHCNSAKIGDKILSGPKVIKFLTCSTQLSMNSFLLINVEMPAFQHL